MKQFEKWLDKNHKHWRRFPCITSTYKEGWRAALEWVKTLPSSGTYKFEEPMRFINKELEGGD